MRERDPIAGAAWTRIVALLGALALAACCNSSGAAECTITVGVVLELTGPAGDYGQAAAKAVEMAFRDLNAAGGVRGCRIVTNTKDSQSQSTVAVDAANQLVQLGKVPVIIGGVLSSVTIPMLTAVTGPARVLQISPGASSPKLTALGREGKTNGMFFRTITSDALQGSVAAKYALDRGMHRMAVIYVNNDYGVDLYDEFARTYKGLGGVIVSATRYNEKQSSYASEVTAALASASDGLYLISTPVDGSTIARAWISMGGPRRFLLNDGMNSADFIQGVGAKYLSEAYGTSSGTSATASTASFEREYKAFARMDPGSPAADRAYDAAAIVGLAIAAATRAEPAAIRSALFAVTDPKGTVIHIGADEFAKALALIRNGKPIRYEGVIGPVAFDAYGDITGPFRLWRITDGAVTTVGQMSADEVNALVTRLGR
jgi:ABC-type branched-subunit amino acid transport system substrate-binding protein